MRFRNRSPALEPAPRMTTQSLGSLPVSGASAHPHSTMPQSPDAIEDVVATQQAALRKLYNRHLRHGSRYALIDFPDHANVGDSAIWLGELAMLRQVTGRDPEYVATWHDFDAAAFATMHPDTILLLHGGGNLGDIWPHHQRLRETILTDIRNRPVVQLPQSIHFRDVGSARRFADIAAAHPDFTLYVRDRPSATIAAELLGCHATIAPDSAFALGRQIREPASVPLLGLMRTDAERRAHAGPLPQGAEIVDWLQDDPGLPAGSTPSDRERQARHRVARGLRLLSRGEQVVTDRLHGHILALLLDIPHRVLDNDYGKVGAYVAAWTAASPLVQMAA